MLLDCDLRVVLLTSACGGSAPSAPPASSSAPSTASRANVSLDKNAYPVFPNADAGADPAVPAEQGGKGIQGRGLGDQYGFSISSATRAR